MKKWKKKERKKKEKGKGNKKKNEKWKRQRLDEELGCQSVIQQDQERTWEERDKRRRRERERERKWVSLFPKFSLFANHLVWPTFFFLPLCAACDWLKTAHSSQFSPGQDVPCSRWWPSCSYANLCCKGTFGGGGGGGGVTQHVNGWVVTPQYLQGHRLRHQPHALVPRETLVNRCSLEVPPQKVPN